MSVEASNYVAIMKLALWHEAMAKEPNRNQAKREKHEATAKFIRQAIARAERSAEGTLEAGPSRSDIKQEPVAWQVHPFDYGIGHEGVYARTDRPEQVEAWKRKGWNVQPLYTHPYTRQPKREPLTDEQIDYSIKKNNIVTSKSWSLTELIVVDVNWALGAVAVQLGYGGGIVVWPALSLKKEAAHGIKENT